MQTDQSIADVMNGFSRNETGYRCLYCDFVVVHEQIYPVGEQLLTAAGAIRAHVTSHHQGPLQALLTDPSALGVSAAQAKLLALLAQGLSDTVISQRLGLASATVRNQRFKLRTKQRQATRFLAVMQLLAIEDGTLLPHAGATMLDERYAITPAERDKVLKTFMTPDGRIDTWPSKEKRKLVLLATLAQMFDPQKNYSEAAVNEQLRRHVDDYVTVRRNLIEYGFLARTTDGRTYWVRH
ncbi:DUF2087 domain-containing protein [Lacticaseibacillus absianus]|uniref:DUF2087 domain-containing protein n=1 Tax=Lacticaseibacillus absianus TaxID=2729623 RepID=UPI0015CC6D4E|nr:DUF2087 domain-containing protein [Lacticaseibacillus absianus]